MTGLAEWWVYAAARGPEVWLRTVEHLMLTGASTLVAVLVGVPLAVAAHLLPRLRAVVLSGVAILQTIPSLAMLVLLLVLFGRIGVLPALVALILYALLPVVRNTLTGLDEIDPAVAEAARGVGMTTAQELRMVRLPLAAPVAAAGVRTAAVIGVGIATLSAFIGAGGLGDFINRGLALSDARLILLGAIPAGLLALVVDGSIAGLEWAADARRHRNAGPGQNTLRVLAVALPTALVVAPVAIWAWGGPEGAVASAGGDPAAFPGTEPVRVCSKNFTEQLVLGELVAQALEGRGLAVDRRLNLGGTMICHGALVRGEVDVYVEYTGTALTAVLGREVESAEPETVFRDVAEAYEARFGVRWLPPLGFDNTYVLLAHRGVARAEGWRTVSDVADGADRLSAGMTAEFAERPDGYPGFRDHYGFGFGSVRDLDPGILYEALARGEVDVAFGFATDGRIAMHDLAVLQDDRGFFPPYEAAPVVRGEILAGDPAVGAALRSLGGQVADSVMRRLNREVDAQGRPAADVARDFLLSRGLVER